MISNEWFINIFDIQVPAEMREGGYRFKFIMEGWTFHGYYDYFIGFGEVEFDDYCCVRD